METYPHEDEYGTLWLDRSGFYDASPPAECFICHRSCNRLDVNFSAFFCNSQECNDTIERDLESQPYDDTVNDWWADGGK